MSKGKPMKWVYLIGSPLVVPVKIGFSRNPALRLMDLQVGSPVPLSLLWMTPGTRELERMLHDYFVHYRSHGEWFDFGQTNPIAAVSGALSLFGYRQAVAPAPPQFSQLASEPGPEPATPAPDESGPEPATSAPNEADLTDNQRAVLKVVRDGATTNAEISKATGINPGSVARAVDALAKRGLLSKDGTAIRLGGAA